MKSTKIHQSYKNKNHKIHPKRNTFLARHKKHTANGKTQNGKHKNNITHIPQNHKHTKRQNELRYKQISKENKHRKTQQRKGYILKNKHIYGRRNKTIQNEQQSNEKETKAYKKKRPNERKEQKQQNKKLRLHN